MHTAEGKEGRGWYVGTTFYRKARPPTARYYHQPQGFTTNRKVLSPTARYYHQAQGISTNRKVLPPTARYYHQPQGTTTNRKARGRTEPLLVPRMVPDRVREQQAQAAQDALRRLCGARHLGRRQCTMRQRSSFVTCALAI
eukprot:6197905-Pleurochrysis_carterae.AAC.1